MEFVRMKKLLFIMWGAMLMVMSAGCSSDDDTLTLGSREDFQPIQSELCKTWQLIGYGSEDNFHTIAEEYRKKSDTYGYRFYVTFRPDGTLTGRESINEIFGKYSCNGDQIKIEELGSTFVYDEKGYEESIEFLWRLRGSSSYGINDGKTLRLYYPESQPDGIMPCVAYNFLYFEAIEKGKTISLSESKGWFYINMMPSDVGPGFCFFCNTEEIQVAFRIIGIKASIDDFQVGETFELNQFSANVYPNDICGTPPVHYDEYEATKGSIKLLDKKKGGDKDVLTFQINNLDFENLYTINGIVDYVYEGTIY